MKLDLDAGGVHRNSVAGYGPGYIEVGGHVYSTGLLICHDAVVAPWGPDSAGGLAQSHLLRVLEHEPEIVLLGTGDRLVFPAPELMSMLATRGVGFEVMDTGAACRSFNFLLGEGRRVVAALLQMSRNMTIAR